MLKVHLCTFHNDMSILSLGILIDLVVGDEVADILDHKWTGLGEIAHIGYFIVEILILVIGFDFNLLKCVNIILKRDFVHMGISSPYFLHHSDVFKIVVSFDEVVIPKQI